MLTVIETYQFKALADRVWSESERLDFISWISENPESGDVIPNSNGARKLRWSAKGKGKRGGARIIYFNVSSDGFLILVYLYLKSDTENVSQKNINRLILWT